jgi:hypothetical protein
MSEFPFDPDFLPDNLRHIEPFDPFACPIGIAIWEEYRRRNPDGLTVPPTDGRGIKDPELLPYLNHIDRCEDCNEV